MINGVKMSTNLKDVTFVIKSYERKQCVENLVESILFYFDCPKIIIVDDSKEPLFFNFIKNEHIRVYYIGYNKGLSYGRNFAVSKVKTSFFVLLDDDFLFTKKTDISLLLNNIVEMNADIVGGVCIDFGFKKRIYDGVYSVSNGILNLIISDRKDVIRKVDFCLNFFIAKTEAIIKCPWDNNIKIHREHDDFFIRAKDMGLVVYHNDLVEIEHHPSTNKKYINSRRIFDIYEQYFNEKHQVKERYILGKTTTIKYFYKAIFSITFYKYIFSRFFC